MTQTQEQLKRNLRNALLDQSRATTPCRLKREKRRGALAQEKEAGTDG